MPAISTMSLAAVSSGRRASFAANTSGTFFATATIVEVFARDRPGLLYAIVAALADAGLDISVSKIATEGEKVSDVFYVTAGGAKVADAAALAAVAARVTAAIEAA